jgi:hypothetical protein
VPSGFPSEVSATLTSIPCLPWTRLKSRTIARSGRVNGAEVPRQFHPFESLAPVESLPRTQRAAQVQVDQMPGQGWRLEVEVAPEAQAGDLGHAAEDLQLLSEQEPLGDALVEGHRAAAPVRPQRPAPLRNPSGPVPVIRPRLWAR